MSSLESQTRGASEKRERMVRARGAHEWRHDVGAAPQHILVLPAGARQEADQPKHEGVEEGDTREGALVPRDRRAEAADADEREADEVAEVEERRLALRVQPPEHLEAVDLAATRL